MSATPVPRIVRPLPESRAARAAAALFERVVWLRSVVYDTLPSLAKKAPRPVISIGGISAGGSGKTPLALMVGEYLHAKGVGVAFLSRGYRRTDRHTRIVAPGETVDWGTIGDEPWMLHQRLPEAWLGIDAQRIRAARRLGSRLPDRAVFVLDDGFQHRALHRDLDIVCLNTTILQDRMIPAGYLREPLFALKRAHGAVLVGTRHDRKELHRVRELLRQRFPELPIFIALQEPRTWIHAATGQCAVSPPLEAPVLVCGIARPERFTALVREQGIVPCKELIFPDHHRYLRNDFAETRELYSNGIITTEKDAMKFRGNDGIPVEKLWYLAIRLCFDEAESENRFFGLIDKQLFPF